MDKIAKNRRSIKNNNLSVIKITIGKKEKLLIIQVYASVTGTEEEEKIQLFYKMLKKTYDREK